jgi:hypothetical protein
VIDERAIAEGLDRLRAVATDFPECVVDGDQHHAFRIRKKTFAYHTVDHHGDGRVALVCKAERGELEALVEADPVRFFRPPYMAHHGYIGVYLDVENVDWDEVFEQLTEGYRLAAPKRLVAQLDEG